MRLREATLRDSASLLRWRNDPESRASSRNGKPISGEQHAEWLTETLADPDTHLFIAEDDAESIGEVRFDPIGPGYEVSVCLDPHRRGEGFGSKLLVQATEWIWENTGAEWIQAIVRTENERSRLAFNKAGFEGEKDNGFICMTLERP